MIVDQLHDLAGHVLVHALRGEQAVADQHDARDREAKAGDQGDLQLNEANGGK